MKLLSRLATTAAMLIAWPVLTAWFCFTTFLAITAGVVTALGDTWTR